MTPHATRNAAARARALDLDGHHDRARDLVDRAIEDAPADRALLFLRGSFAERDALAAHAEPELAAALAAAEEAYAACLAPDAHASSERASGERASRDDGDADERAREECAAATRLATVHLLQGRARDAAHRFDQALELDPSHLEALLGRIEAAIFDGDARWALVEVEETLRESVPDGWILGALACVRLGLDADAARLAHEAVALAKERTPIARHRAAILEEVVALLAETAAAERGGAA